MQIQCHFLIQCLNSKNKFHYLIKWNTKMEHNLVFMTDIYLSYSSGNERNSSSQL